MFIGLFRLHPGSNAASCVPPRLGICGGEAQWTRPQRQPSLTVAPRYHRQTVMKVICFPFLSSVLYSTISVISSRTVPSVVFPNFKHFTGQLFNVIQNSSIPLLYFVRLLRFDAHRPHRSFAPTRRYMNTASEPQVARYMTT